MKSKLLGVCVTVVLCSAWWTGCSSDSSSSGTNPTPDSGGTPDTGGNTEGGSIDDSGTDGPNQGLDAALTGPFIPITYGACPASAPCGGDVKGTWKLTGGCVTEALFAAAKGQCPTLAESNVVIEARGVVAADAVTITRNSEVKFSATLAVPAACKPGAATCAQIGTAIIASGAVKTATCVDDGAGCTCQVTNALADSTSEAYTTAGNTLTTGAAPNARTFDYCVAASELKYKETTAGSSTVPATFVLTK
jgi:hypothetical protein